MAVNKWLHWYHMYRQPESDEGSSFSRLDETKMLYMPQVRATCMGCAHLDV